MEYNHNVIDDDPHFIIDPETRSITYTSPEKLVLIQGDHNSERFTFELPSVIDGHDMAGCNLVQVHYININGSNTAGQSPGVYEVKASDISVSDGKVVLSWLVSQNATRYVGTLNFALRFICKAEDGSTEYAWNTAPYSGALISTGIDNTEDVVEEYYDVLETWYNQLVNAGSTSLTAIEEAKAKALNEIDTQVKASSDVYAEKLKSTLTSDVLGVENVLVQEAGNNPDKIMSQAAVTSQYESAKSKMASLHTETVNEVRALKTEIEENTLNGNSIVKCELSVDAIMMGDELENVRNCKIGVGKYRIYRQKDPDGSWDVQMHMEYGGNAQRNIDPNPYSEYVTLNVMTFECNEIRQGPHLAFRVDGSETRQWSGMCSDFDSELDPPTLRLCNVDKVYLINEEAEYIVRGNGIADITKIGSGTPTDIYVVEENSQVGPYETYSDRSGRELVCYIVDTVPSASEMNVSVGNGPVYAYILNETGIPYITRDGTTVVTIGNNCRGWWTEDLDSLAIGEAYTLLGGHKNTYLGNPIRVIVVDTIPEVGEIFDGGEVGRDDLVCYLQTSDMTMWVYNGPAFDNAWEEFTDNFTIISDPADATDATVGYIVYTPNTGIWSVKTSLADTYRISFDNGTTFDYQVTNGNGITSVERTDRGDYEDTYKMYFTDGSVMTFKVPNGGSVGIKKTVTGEIVSIDDISPIEHGVKVNVKSKNLIPNTYTSSTVDGVTFTANADGTITISGTPTATVTFQLYANRTTQNILKRGKTYTMSLQGSPNSNVVYINTNISRNGTDWAENIANTMTGASSFTVNEDFAGLQAYIVILASAGELSNVTVKPQLEEGSVATSYTPYVDVSTLKLTTCGKNRIPFPYPLLSGTIQKNGLTIAVQDDGGVLIDGTATAETYINLANVTMGPKTIYPYSTHGLVSSRYSGDLECCFDGSNGLTYIRVANGMVCDNIVFYPQIEAGTVSTTYEKGIPAVVYTPNLDGSVSGVDSIAPVMNIFADKPGVIIEAKYNKDIQATLEEVGEVKNHVAQAEAYVNEAKAAANIAAADVAAKAEEMIAELGVVQEAGTSSTAVMSQVGVSNTFANALKKTVSGEEITLTDVSPVEHIVGVKLKGGNNYFNALAVSPRQQNAYLSISAVSEGSITVTTLQGYDGNGAVRTNRTLKEICPHLKLGKSYVLNATSQSSKTVFYLIDSQVEWWFGNSVLITESILNSVVQVYGYPYSTGVGDCVISNIRVTETGESTKYTPYFDASSAVLTVGDKTYTPSADGTVDGVTSTAPSMSFSTDTEGVVITVTYNRDVAVLVKGLAEAQAEIERLKNPVTPVVIDNFQTLDGWSALTMANNVGSISADTEDFLFGTQSVKFENAIQKTGLNIDMRGKEFRVKFKVNSTIDYGTLTLYISEDSTWANHGYWQLYSNESADSDSWVTKRVQKGEWVELVLPWSSIHGATDIESLRSSISIMRFRFANATGSANIQMLTAQECKEPKGVLTFTFDDGTLTDYTKAAPILGARGISATTFIITSEIGYTWRMTEAQLTSLKYDYGWDIEGHWYEPMEGYTEEELVTAFESVKEWFKGKGLGQYEHFAYSHGSAGGLAEKVARRYFASARLIDGFITESTTKTNPYRLSAITGVGDANMNKVKTAITNASLYGGWVILILHTIDDETYGCSSDTLAQIADHAIASGIEIKTIAEVMRR